MVGVITPTNAPTVLVVDDNSTLRLTIAAALSASGARVLQAVDGRDALVHASLTLPDVVVSDIDMPRMGGIALCQSLKGNPRSSHVPVVLMSGEQVRIEDVAGADAFLVKPFSVGQLSRLIGHLLAPSHS